VVKAKPGIKRLYISKQQVLMPRNLILSIATQRVRRNNGLQRISVCKLYFSGLENGAFEMAFVHW
jgi:hypothetical protein